MMNRVHGDPVRRSVIAFLAFWLIALSASRPHAQQPDSTTQSAKPDSSLLTPAFIDAGRKLFHGRGTCSVCHGNNLQGGPIAPALTGPTWRHINGSFNAIVNRIDNGYPGSLMVAHPGRITEAQVVQVAAYIYAVSHGLAKP